MRFKTFSLNTVKKFRFNDIYTLMLLYTYFYMLVSPSIFRQCKLVLFLQVFEIKIKESFITLFHDRFSRVR